MVDDHRRRRVLQLSAAALVGLAGCSSDGDGGTPTATDEPSPTPSPTDTGGATPTDGTTATATATDTETATPTATGTPSPEPDQVVEVGADGLNFKPDSFSIDSGDTVLWTWVGFGHNVSPESQPDDASWPGEDDSTYGEGHTYAYTFEVTGTYAYHCDPHQGQGMRGSFTVG